MCCVKWSAVGSKESDFDISAHTKFACHHICLCIQFIALALNTLVAVSSSFSDRKKEGNFSFWSSYFLLSWWRSFWDYIWGQGEETSRLKSHRWKFIQVVRYKSRNVFAKLVKQSQVVCGQNLSAYHPQTKLWTPWTLNPFWPEVIHSQQNNIIMTERFHFNREKVQEFEFHQEFDGISSITVVV